MDDDGDGDRNEMQVSTIRNIGLLGASSAAGGLAVSSLGIGGAVAQRTFDEHPVVAGGAVLTGAAGSVGGAALSGRILSQATPMLDAGIGARGIGVAAVLGGMVLGMAPGALAVRLAD